MADEEKEEGGGFEAFAELVGAFFEHFKPTEFIRKNVVEAFEFEPYFVIAVALVFFFGWMPTHLEASYYMGIVFFFLMIFVLPFLLFELANKAWDEHERLQRYLSHEYCVLQIRLPEEITQSPQAAELMLRGLYQTGDVDTPLARLQGAYSPWFSLEIASDEGRVSFYMWMQRRHRQLVENQIYAHYPTVQVVEVPDYTLSMPFDPAVVSVWGVEQRLQKPDPYPIVTYEELGTLKADMKEELKNDPLAGLIELMGSIKKGEHIWMQIIIRAHKAKQPCPWAIETAHEELDLQEWADKEIAGITKSVADEKGKFNFNSLTQGDKDKIAAMQMKLNKQLFEVGIRTMYIAYNEAYSGPPRQGIPSTMRHFEHGSEGRGLNGLRPIFWIGPFDYGWQDFRNIRRDMLRKRFYDAYVTRQFFFPPHKHRYIVLNTEELATLYHFPGSVVRTPTLERMPSRRAEAPSNLPV